MAFARRERSGYARLGKMDFQHPVHAEKKRFRLVPCLENITVHGDVAFDAACFRISPVLSREIKTLTDIHRNVSLIHSVMI